MDPSLPLAQIPVDIEFLSGLELLDRTERPMPGSWVRRRSAPDPRLPHLKPLFGPGWTAQRPEAEEVAMYTHMATVRQKRTGKLYVAFRESMDALLERQSDPVLYPEWLMKHPVKKTELRIHIYEVVRRPEGRDDRGWIRPLDNEQVFETISYYLLRKGVFTEEMFGRGR